MQYVGKAETDFGVRLNNHCKDVYKADPIPVSHHFAMKDHIFNRDASLILIKQIRKGTLRRESKKRENLWIMKPETLKRKGLNQVQNK